MSYVSDNFKMLSEICYCISRQFGPQCEVVLHDLTRPYDNTIVAIYNGHVTGRQVGDGGTNAGLGFLRKTKEVSDEFCYINRTDEGKVLRSSSKYICVDGEIVGSICINYDITKLLDIVDIIDNITYKDAVDTGESEIFSGNIDTLLDRMIAEEIRRIGKDVSELSKDEKSRIVNNLDKKGAFLIKKSSERIAEALCISRFTIYNYINENNEEKSNVKDSD